MNDRKAKKVIAIVGPTASGKTSIGVKLAQEFGGEIISADSRQVYRELDLGTGKEGKPTGEYRNSNIEIRNNIQIQNSNVENLRRCLRCVDGIDQWMIDIVDPGEKMTLFDYLPLATAAIDDIFSRGKLPIIVSGTGLYIQALVEGFRLEPISNSKFLISKQIPNSKNQKKGVILNDSEESLVSGYLPGDPSVPQDDNKGKTEDDKLSREQLNCLTVKQLNEILQKIDVDRAQTVDKKNVHRLIRAIELAQEGLKPIKIKPDFEVLQIGIDIPRGELHQRIDKRVDERFEQGMLEEVQGLIDQGVSTDWLINLGLEYRVITEYLQNCHPEPTQSSIQDPEKNRTGFSDGVRTLQTHAESSDRIKSGMTGDFDFNNMKQNLKFKIHQFARRQLTWFRRFPEINWLRDYKEIKRFAKIFLEH